MAKLNFYDTDAVKAFVLNILIENAELKAIWTMKEVFERLVRPLQESRSASERP